MTSIFIAIGTIYAWRRKIPVTPEDSSEELDHVNGRNAVTVGAAVIAIGVVLVLDMLDIISMVGA
jgi:hypothetical protein